MKLTQFQTDKRLWIGLSLILFVVSFWIPWLPPSFLGPDSSLTSPVRLLRTCLEYNRYLQTLTPLFDEQGINWRDYLSFTYFLWPSTVFSILFVWLLHCTVVI